ncbi:uncharacterized protein PGTG_07307 [Puccinia graminis f. sp. tritici CRL 75-36-700-3]|uniref:Cyclin-like domain-containing protein n=1 Tax=Puccinia graminis f. sp. tritici (strain CRL 75-36-700-3 / race SCCL) TaxID=418459 RepID=E3K9A5_PUCGT|nr:uncharacterized protein PGTG_07307 [Puccinia graminis f. sp. tritici CRL 75-36-700-3]EFP81055.2 hypothetical protein PGTG_07307 [Puccinia graminis f. sp. tritici CRL 75-36-700-3]
MGWSEEINLRAWVVNWIIRISITLQLAQLIITTTAAYVHWFYMRKPLQRYPPKMMSATSLFLATKVEEVPRKLECVVCKYFSVNKDDNEQTGPISDSSNSLLPKMADWAKAKLIAQAAWGFINDSLMSPLCLVAKPELISALALLLAISHCLSKSPPSYPDQEGNHQEPHNIKKIRSTSIVSSTFPSQRT